MTKFRISSRP